MNHLRARDVLDGSPGRRRRHRPWSGPGYIRKESIYTAEEGKCSDDRMEQGAGGNEAREGCSGGCSRCVSRSLQVQLRYLMSFKTSRRDSEPRQISYVRHQRRSSHANTVGQLHLGVLLAGRIVFLRCHCTDNVIVVLPLHGEQLQKTPKEEMQDSLDELQG